MKVIAKCTNYSGCLVAYRGEKVELAEGAPLVCPECGKPLAVVKGGSAAIIKIAAIAVGVVLVAGGAFFAAKVFKKKPAEPAPIGATTPEPIAASTPEPGYPPPPVPPTPDTPPVAPPPPVNAGTPSTPAVAEPPPGPAVADQTPVTEDVRTEVLKRIDEMPNIAPEKKDKLYNSVRRARDMRRIVVIPFGSGQTGIPGAQQGNVKGLLSSAEVMKFRDDLTAVFVVLGFADSVGDPKSNLALSGARSKNVKDFMVTQCGIRNVTHDVAMGPSKLVDKDAKAKNRIVEIWAVLP